MHYAILALMKKELKNLKKNINPVLVLDVLGKKEE